MRLINDLASLGFLAASGGLLGAFLTHAPIAARALFF